MIVGFNPPAGYVYFPSMTEMLVSMGLLSIEVLAFMYIVRYFPILPAPRDKKPRMGETGSLPSGASPAA